MTYKLLHALFSSHFHLEHLIFLTITFTVHNTEM
uniref:Uncharacterized protein n=1 Tax=Anguilla anguilla TaxID=7936 RepID=A0A0E9UAL5_ANGAN